MNGVNNQIGNGNDAETNLYEELIVYVVLLTVAISLLYILIVAHTEIFNNFLYFALYFFELLFFITFLISLFGKRRTFEYKDIKKGDKMATNDEIIEEINGERKKQQRSGILMLPTNSRAENYKDLIKAMDKARADERARIKGIILNYIDSIDLKMFKDDCDKDKIDLLEDILDEIDW